MTSGVEPLVSRMPFGPETWTLPVPSYFERAPPGPFPQLLEGDVAIRAALSERVLVLFGAEEPEVPTLIESEVDGLLGFLAAKITARFFQRADERALHDGPHAAGLCLLCM